MSNPAPLPQDLAPDPAVLRAERRLRVLEELTEIGMELARTLQRIVAEKPAYDDDADEAPAPTKVRGKPFDPADAFARISRAVRLTVALAAKTDEALRDLKAGVVREREEARVQAAERATIESMRRSREREDLVPALVSTAAKAEIEDPDALEALYEALDERLTEDEAYDNFAERPLRETVERLCKDLGLSPDWSRWGDDGEGWIEDGLHDRDRDSPFNQPSPHPLLKDGPWNAAPRQQQPPPPPAGMRYPPHLE